MGIWRDRERGHWVWEFQYQKKKYRGRGYPTKAAARMAREERRKELKQKIPRISTGMVFSQVANIYLDDCQRRFTQKTYQQKRLTYKEFIASQGDPPLDQITPQTLHDYLKTRPTNANYNKRRKDLCALWTWTRTILKIPVPHPCWDLKKMPHKVSRPLPPSEEEILRIIMAAEGEDRQLIQILVHTLARIDEILRLTWEDVNFEQRWVRLWTRKRRDGSWEADELHMNEDLHKVLTDLWRNKQHSKWIFLNSRTRNRYLRRPKLMRRLCRIAGIPNYGFHGLRRGVATLLQDKEKVGTKTVSGLLRHRRVSTTEQYLFVMPADQVAALKKLEGKFGGGSGGGFGKKALPESTPNGKSAL